MAINIQHTQFNFAKLRDEAVDPLNLTFLEDRGYGTIIPFFWANENARLTPEYTGSFMDVLHISN